jgi:uncharacterized protein (TIGR00251 family)
MPLKIAEQNGAVVVEVKVVPNSSREMIAGLLGDRLKIKVAPPPEDGKANRAVEELLARTLGVAASQVTVVAGHMRPQKTVRIVGVAAAVVRAKLGG